MAVYELPLSAKDPFAPASSKAEGSRYLSESLLFQSVLWFCQLRWVVVGILVAFGALGLFPGLLPRIGLRAHPEWPFVAAAVLGAANVVFLGHARRLARSPAASQAKANLWAQIILDLLVLTVVVHYMGSLETYVAFAYLFHIVLSCIFFPRPGSLAVTAIACILYIACVVLEEARIVPTVGIYSEAALRQQIERIPGASLLNILWATVTWVVVWYLASHLSAMVRERDNELAETNRRLLAAQEERTRHMLSTTHELKAPFAAIDANVQLLLKGYGGPMPDQAHNILVRIAARSRRLAGQIQEMLQLANLQSASQTSLCRSRVDLAGALRWCAAQVRPMAEQRGVTLVLDLQCAYTWAVPDYVKMLFSNLLSNAIVYSHPGGRVEVRCAPASGSAAVVTVEDHGIGIEPEKLSRIFDAYYRTDEAVRHYKESTGLGLAIVRHVVETHGIRVQVESEPGVGTKFRLRFPPTSDGDDLNGDRKE